MLPILHLDDPQQLAQLRHLYSALRLDAADLALSRGRRAQDAQTVQTILADVAQRGDAALVELSQKFDDSDFSAQQIRVTPQEMCQAAGRVPAEQMRAIRRSIEQVRQYQQHIMPITPPPLKRPGVELGLRFTPLDSAGCYVPGGKASYPSSLIMQVVPAQVAQVKRVIACTTPSRFGRSDLVMAAAHELGLEELYRCNGIAAIAAMAFGTATIAPVDKIVGPGHPMVQMAKRALAGTVGIDGFLGASEIVTIADDSAQPAFIAADLLAQAEHDPGSCFLLTDSADLAQCVLREVARQAATLERLDAIAAALKLRSAIVVGPMDELIEWANRLAAEHVNLQTRDDEAVLARLTHAGAVFVGPYAPVAAGDYVAGPSHCLPTNTSARFASGISVYEFLKRAGVERYTRAGLADDAEAIITLAQAEGLTAHANSVKIRLD